MATFQLANFEIKDGEYTKTIYSMIKEQRFGFSNIKCILLLLHLY